MEGIYGEEYKYSDDEEYGKRLKGKDGFQREHIDQYQQSSSSSAVYDFDNSAMQQSSSTSPSVGGQDNINPPPLNITVKLNGLETIEEEVEEFLIADYSLLPAKSEEEKNDGQNMGFNKVKDRKKVSKFSEDLKSSLKDNDCLIQSPTKSKTQ